MKQVITKEDVADAMALMKSESKKITLNSLHAALNHRGSMTTLMRLKSELELAAQPAGPVASPEGLATFWELWALAVEEGQKQQEPVINQLREDQKALLILRKTVSVVLQSLGCGMIRHEREGFCRPIGRAAALGGRSIAGRL